MSKNSVRTTHPEDGPGWTSPKAAFRHVKRGIARWNGKVLEFLPRTEMPTAARFYSPEDAIPVKRDAIDARIPKPARVTWPAHFAPLIAQARPDLPGDPSFLHHFLPQGGIGLDQRTNRGGRAA